MRRGWRRARGSAERCSNRDGWTNWRFISRPNCWATLRVASFGCRSGPRSASASICASTSCARWATIGVSWRASNADNERGSSCSPASSRPWVISPRCSTAAAIADHGFSADCSAETLRCTTLGAAHAGDAVNLEKALTPSTPLGGHLVSGHVDGIATLAARTEVGGSLRLANTVSAPLAKYIAGKGSICVIGVSLTENAVDGACFEVNLVPHTLQETYLGGLAGGDAVIIVVDLVARFLERLLLGDAAARPAGAGLTRELLGRYGFINRGERR